MVIPTLRNSPTVSVMEQLWKAFHNCSIHTHTPTSGRVIGMHTFGASAPLKELQKKFGFEPDRVAAVAKELLGME